MAQSRSNHHRRYREIERVRGGLEGNHKNPKFSNFKNWEPSVGFTICVTIFLWNDTKHPDFSRNLRSWSSVCVRWALDGGLVCASFKPSIGPLFYFFSFFFCKE